MLHVFHEQVNVSTVLLQAHHINNKRVFQLAQEAKFIAQMLLLFCLHYINLRYYLDRTDSIIAPGKSDDAEASYSFSNLRVCE
jgi:hypothetical protein